MPLPKPSKTVSRRIRTAKVAPPPAAAVDHGEPQQQQQHLKSWPPAQKKRKIVVICTDPDATDSSSDEEEEDEPLRGKRDNVLRAPHGHKRLVREICFPAPAAHPDDKEMLVSFSRFLRFPDSERHTQAWEPTREALAKASSSSSSFTSCSSSSCPSSLTSTSVLSSSGSKSHAALPDTTERVRQSAKYAPSSPCLPCATTGESMDLAMSCEDDDFPLFLKQIFEEEKDNSTLGTAWDALPLDLFLEDLDQGASSFADLESIDLDLSWTRGEDQNEDTLPWHCQSHSHHANPLVF